MKKQTERMMKGELYNSAIPELHDLKMKEQELLYDFNHLRPSEEEKTSPLLHQLFPHLGENSWMEQGFRVEYGVNTPSAKTSMRTTIASSTISARSRSAIT
jgi:galactoside O-acetyltransferase